MQSLAKEVKQELTGRIVPFWEGLRDEEYGGFYGYQDFDLNVQKTYEKGCILNSRILWFFCTCTCSALTTGGRRFCGACGIRRRSRC